MRRLLLLPLLAACQKAPSPNEAAPRASAPASVTPLASAAAPRAWFEGVWQGSFQAELFRIELLAGGVKEWKQDDGKRASGAGTLELSIAADGSVTGSASGALGKLAASGRADGDRVALSLSSTEPEGFHGVVLASQTPEGMRGTLSASSGDSLQVRKADVTLARATP